MPYQGGPSETVKSMIARSGGVFWTSILEPAAGGTGTAATNLSTTFRVPDAAKMLIGWRPVEVATATAEKESTHSVFSIGGNNYNYQPQEVVCGNVATAALGTAGALPQMSEYYDAFAPVAGGETWTITVEPLDAIAGDRASAAEFYWTDKKLALPVIYSECSREVASGTAAAVAAGTTLNINNAHELIEVGGVATGSTPTADEALWGHITLKCTAWSPIQTIDFLLEPSGEIAATLGSLLCGVARRPQRMKFTTDRASITCSFDQHQTVTVAGQFGHYIRWI